MKNLNTLIKIFFLLVALGASVFVFNACEKDEKESNNNAMAVESAAAPLPMLTIPLDVSMLKTGESPVLATRKD